MLSQVALTTRTASNVTPYLLKTKLSAVVTATWLVSRGLVVVSYTWYHTLPDVDVSRSVKYGATQYVPAKFELVSPGTGTV